MNLNSRQIHQEGYKGDTFNSVPIYLYSIMKTFSCPAQHVSIAKDRTFSGGKLL